MRKTNDTYMAQLLEIHGGTLYNIDEYNGAHNKILHECFICANKWIATPGHVINSRTGCPKCATVNSANSQRKTHAQFLIDLTLKNSTCTPLDEYTGAYNKIRFQCGVCNNIWATTPHNLQGCPYSTCVNRNRVGYYSSNNIPEFLSIYLVEIEYNEHSFLKLGLSVNVSNRISKLKEELPDATIYIHNIVNMEGLKAVELECLLLSSYPKYCCNLKFGGHSECLDKKQLNSLTKFLSNLHENIQSNKHSRSKVAND